jgi:hypothetical protein
MEHAGILAKKRSGRSALSKARNNRLNIYGHMAEQTIQIQKQKLAGIL